MGLSSAVLPVGLPSFARGVAFAEDLLEVAVQQFVDFVRHGHLRLLLQPHSYSITP